VLVAGDPGAGKTRLTKQFLNAHDVAAHWSHCHEEPGAPPFWPRSRLIESHLATSLDDREATDHEVAPRSAIAPLFARTVAEPRSSEASGEMEQVFLLFAGVRRLLVDTIHEPVVFVLEDIHWGDHASLSLLRSRERSPISPSRIASRGWSLAGCLRPPLVN